MTVKIQVLTSGATTDQKIVCLKKKRLCSRVFSESRPVTRGLNFAIISINGGYEYSYKKFQGGKQIDNSFFLGFQTSFVKLFLI